MCQRRRAVRRIENFPGSHAVTHLRMPEKLATRMMHWCIDCWAQIFAAYNQLITFTYPTHTTHSHAPSRKYNCTMGNKTIYIMEIPQSQTKCSLYNSISGATDYCALSLHSTCIHRRAVEGGTGPPPQFFYWLHLGGGAHVPQIFTGYIMIGKVYLKRISNFFKICSKFS